MLTGFNTNIRHRGVLFHVQSEDSGRAHPHIITHLYYGGTIIASEKSSYSSKLDSDDLEDLVRQQMESQHKAFLKRLVARLFDEKILERLGNEVFTDVGDTKSTARPADTQPALSEPPAPAASPVQPEAPAEAQTRRPVEQPAAAASEAVDEPEAAAPDKPETAAPDEPETAAPDKPETAAPRPFGEGIVTEKPLDEVILSYLVENARKRKRRTS